MICPYCKTLVVDKKFRTSVYDSHCEKHHNDCFNEWRMNVERFNTELDRPANACVYFQRIGSSMAGYYVRDNKRHLCLADWKEAHIFGTFLFPPMVGKICEGGEYIRVDYDHVKLVYEPRLLLESFRAFLQKHGWFNETWFEFRKPIEYDYSVLNKRTKGV
jgi:hypothetical protein